MEKIFYKKELIAIRIKKLKNGITSPTDTSESLQIVTHNRTSGEKTKPHMHSPKKRVTQKLQECLVVLKGKIKIDFYSNQKEYFKSIYLKTGEVALFVSGGHGVHILEDSEIIEVKNGPFVDDKVMI